MRRLTLGRLRFALDSGGSGAVEGLETLLDGAGGPGLLFDAYRADRADRADRAIQISTLADASPLWIIGALNGDLLALEAASEGARARAPWQRILEAALRAHDLATSSRSPRAGDLRIWKRLLHAFRCY